MPGLDGVELARVLRRFAAPPALVFVSAYERAAVEAFELRALDYLLKPVSRARVAEALARVTRRRPAGATTPDDARGRRCPAAARGSCRATTILYLQAHGDYVRVVTADGRFLRARARSARSSGAGRRTASTACTARYVVNLRRAVEVRPQLNGTARAGPGRRRRAADRPPRGRRAAPAAALMSRLPRTRT